METNRIHPGDKIQVMIYNPEGKKIDTYDGSEFHTVGDAVRAAFESSNQNSEDIRDYVFRVFNATESTSHRYRVNDHGNVKLIVD